MDIEEILLQALFFIPLLCPFCQSLVPQTADTWPPRRPKLDNRWPGHGRWQEAQRSAGKVTKTCETASKTREDFTPGARHLPARSFWGRKAINQGDFGNHSWSHLSDDCSVTQRDPRGKRFCHCGGAQQGSALLLLPTALEGKETTTHHQELPRARTEPDPLHSNTSKKEAAGCLFFGPRSTWSWHEGAAKETRKLAEIAKVTKSRLCGAAVRRHAGDTDRWVPRRVALAAAWNQSSGALAEWSWKNSASQRSMDDSSSCES